MSTFGLPGCSGLQTTGGGSGNVTAYEYGTLLELYADRANRSDGEAWHITPDADADAERWGVFDSTNGIDGLNNHPFCGKGFFPLNSATMTIGSAVADGEIVASSSGTGTVTLESGYLELTEVASSLQSVYLPALMGRPGMIELDVSWPNAEVMCGLWAGITGVTFSAAGVLLNYLSTDKKVYTQVYTAGTPTSAIGQSIASISSTERVVMWSKFWPTTSQVYYTCISGCYVHDDAIDHYTSNALAVNNGMDYSDASETHYLRFFSNKGVLRAHGIRISTLEHLN